MTASSTDTGDLVHLHVADGVATITLDSPNNRNALSRRLRADLGRHLATATGDDSVRVIVLTHSGPVFCAGADLKEARETGPEEATAELVALLSALLESDKPVVARLSGPARAGGIGLVAACDLAVATAEVTFGFSEVRIGLVPAIITVPLRLRVADGVLQRLFFPAETFDADRAARIGLIDTVSSPDDLVRDVDALVSSLRLGSPLALAAAKCLTRPSSAELGEQFDAMRRLSAQFFSSPDAQEGVRAFAERRPPGWVATDLPSTSGRNRP